MGEPKINPKLIISGNLEAEQEELSDSEKQNELELYIRWWQLNTFLPMLHFLKPPAAFPEDQVCYSNVMTWSCLINDSLTWQISRVAQKLKTYRERDVMPHLINFANEAMRSSMPVIRPMWMIDPFDTAAQVINDQFLIGDTVCKMPPFWLTLCCLIKQKLMYMSIVDTGCTRLKTWTEEQKRILAKR